MKNIKKTALLNHLKFGRELVKLEITQEEFEEEIDISDRYVRELLKSDKNVTISLAYNISCQFGSSIEDLLVIKEDEDY